MGKAARSVGTSFAVERFTLSNGLRVVVSPDRSSPAVAVAVVYDVGFRSEPEGRTGFAHLFEHLMFQGSKNLGKGEFDRLIEGNGGSMNGSTHTDHTLYYEILPSNALEVALFGEADRMDQIVITEENLRNQVDVVKEEINVNVHNRPYGGFPWLHLPQIMFRTFANAHDGYGSFDDLEAATIDDATAFFERYYAPGNAVLSIAGDVDPDQAHTLVERHFSRVPKRKVGKVADFSEPVPDAERRGSHDDPNAPRPAIALGYRVPHPFGAFAEYVATVLLAAVLGDGDASRLYQKLVKEDRVATHVSSYVATFGEWIATRDPTMLEILAYYTDVADTQRVIGSIEEVCARVPEDLSVAELERVINASISDYLREADHLMSRAINFAVCEQQRGKAELLNEIPTLLSTVTVEEVAEVASGWLDPKRRAVLEWRPGR
jgi:zinc protease